MNRTYVILELSHPSCKGEIYNNWFSTDKAKLIESVRKNLEEDVLLEETTLTEIEDGWLLYGDSPERWLRIVELEEIN